MKEIANKKWNYIRGWVKMANWKIEGIENKWMKSNLFLFFTFFEDWNLAPLTLSWLVGDAFFTA